MDKCNYQLVPKKSMGELKEADVSPVPTQQSKEKFFSKRT